MRVLKYIILLCSLLAVPSLKAQQTGNQCRDLSSGISPVVVSSKNYLWVEATGKFSSAFFYIQWVIKLPDGSIVFNSKKSSALSGNNSGVGANAQLTDGCLISASVTMTSTPATYTGQCYVQLYVLPTSNHTIGQLGLSLIGGYLSSNYTLSWPAKQDSSVIGPGFNETVSISNPAAGVDFTNTFNAAQRFRIINIRFTLAAANAGTARNICIKFTDGAGNLFQSACAPVAQAINTTVTYNFTAGIGGSTGTPTAGLDYFVPLPNWVEFSDATILASVIGNINASDQISAIKVRVVDWHEND